MKHFMLPLALALLTTPQFLIAQEQPDLKSATLQAGDSAVADIPIDSWYDQQVAMVEAGVSLADRVELSHRWKNANTWTDLPVERLAWLVASLSLDEVNRERFSVRWTGELTAPRTASYTFEQLAHPSINGTMQVSIDGQVILRHRQADPQAKVDSALFRSKPVPLVTGQSVPIQVEYVFDRGDAFGTPLNGHRDYPMSVLLWESDQRDQEPIPASAYQTLEGQSGLTGEYFKDAAFKQSVGTRIDRSLQLVFSGRAVFSRYSNDQDDVVRAVQADIFERLSRTTAEEQAKGLLDFCGWILPYLSASERLQFLSDLSNQTELIKGLSPTGMALVFSHTAMLPTQNHLDLMGVWGESHLPPPCQPGRYPGNEANGYIAQNYWGSYDAFSSMLSNGLWGNAEYLIEHYLSREDGSCNVAIMYCLASAARYERKASRLYEVINEQLTDDTLSGDQRATWLLGRKYVAEVCVDGTPNPQHGMEYLVEASLVAESPVLQYRIFCEHAKKLISLDRQEEALAVLGQAEAVASDQIQRAEIAELKAISSELQDYYAARQQASEQEQDLAAQAAYLREMQRLQAVASEQGNSTEAERYARAVSSIEESMAAKQEQVE